VVEKGEASFRFSQSIVLENYQFLRAFPLQKDNWFVGQTRPFPDETDEILFTREHFRYTGVNEREPQ